MLQAPLRSEVARYIFQVWYTLAKGSILIFICLYTLWAAAVYYKSSPKKCNPRLCNFSRDCIFKIAQHWFAVTYPHHTTIDNLPRCDDGKKLGSKLIKRLICVKKKINALIFRLITCVNALILTPLVFLWSAQLREDAHVNTGCGSYESLEEALKDHGLEEHLNILHREQMDMESLVSFFFFLNHK